MPLHAAIMLGLGLLLELNLAQEGLLPQPNISAQPGTKVILGHPVTILCKAPVGADIFRVEIHRKFGIEKTLKRCDSLDLNCGFLNQTPMNCDYVDQTVYINGSYKTEALFHIQAVCEGSAGSYHCKYFRDTQWSLLSDALELVVTSEDDSDFNTAPSTPSWRPSVANQVCLGLAGGILLALMGILAEAWYSRHRSKEETQ